MFRERNERDCVELPLVAVSQKHGVMGKRELEAAEGRKLSGENDDLSNYKRVEPGDIVYNKMRMWQGAVGMSGLRGIASPAYVVATPLQGLDSRFAAYLLKSIPYVFQSGLFSYGICDDQNSLRWEDFANLKTPIPPEREQTRIANFLDEQTARIDALIAEKGRLVERLEELKRSRLGQIVTGGASVCRVPTGSKQWSSLPAGWKIGRVKHVAESFDSRRVPLNAEERAVRTGPYPYYGASGPIDMVDDYIFDEPLVLVGEDGANLLNRATPLAFVATGRYWVNNHAHILRPRDGLVRYWAYMLDALDVSDWVTGAAQPKLTIEALMNLPVPIGPRDRLVELEKSAIEAAESLDTLIAHIGGHMERLREYRASLISAAVTGQLDIDNCGRQVA